MKNKMLTVSTISIAILVSGCDTSNENTKTEYQKGYAAGQVAKQNDPKIQKFFADLKKQYESNPVQYGYAYSGAVQGACTSLMVDVQKTGASQEYINGFDDGCLAAQ